MENGLCNSLLQLIAHSLSRHLDRSLVIRRIDFQLILDQKAAMLAELYSDGTGVVERHDVQGHDFLGLLTSIASDMPAHIRMRLGNSLAEVTFHRWVGHPACLPIITCLSPNIQIKEVRASCYEHRDVEVKLRGY